MFRYMLKKCSEGKTLTRIEAKTLMDEIMNGHGEALQVASLLAMMRLRGETVDEMVGFAQSMREHAITVQHDEATLVDTCGTGGDELSTFNISTASAILLSACNVKVAKHGNRAVSSKSGSADVLEQLQIPVQSSPQEAVAAIKEKGLCFLFAPLYHQSMKHVADVRRLLGFKTVFNLLGPLVNPANANRQMIGVFHPTFAVKMARTLRELGTDRALFVTGGDGLDEFSISTHTNVVELNRGDIIQYEVTPEEVGLKRGPIEDIQVSTVDESASLIENIFTGRANKTAKNIVILNSASALYVAEEVGSIKEGVEKVSGILFGFKGLEQLRSLQSVKGERVC